MPPVVVPSQHKRRPWSPSRGYAAFLLAPAAFLAVFFVWPLLRVISRSFTEPILGLQNYQRIADNSFYLKVFGNTLLTATMVTASCLLLAYPLAYAMATSARLGKGLMACVLVALWTSAVIRAYAWLILFQRSGVVNEAMMGLGWITEPVQLLQTPFAVQTAMVHILLPLVVLPLYSTMRNIDATLLRAAAVLGTKPAQVFFRVYLPLSMPGIQSGGLLVFITALGFFIVPSLLGGTGSTMIAVLIEQQASEVLDWAIASALSALLLIATTLIYIAYASITARMQR